MLATPCILHRRAAASTHSELASLEASCRYVRVVSAAACARARRAPRACRVFDLHCWGD